jgi:hypothetical protein
MRMLIEGGHREEMLEYIVSGVGIEESQCVIPAIRNKGGGYIPVCDGPDGLALPGLMTARYS